MRKQTIHPCARKGDIQTQVTSPTSHRRGGHLRYAPCECIRERIDIDRHGVHVPLRFFLGLENENAGQTVWVKRKTEVPGKSVLIAPCEEVFREPDSKGTRLYRKACGRKTRFQGCRATEEGLIRDSLVRILVREKQSLEELLDQIIPQEDDFTLPESRSFHSTHGMVTASEGALKREETKWGETKKAAGLTFSLSTPLSDFLATPPRSFREVQAKALIEEGCFAKDPKLELVAFLISEGITRPEFLKRVVPDLDYGEFKRDEGKVNALINATLPEKAKIFKLFLASLTDIQRKTVQVLYFDNDENLTQVEVAKKLRISYDSLRDRLSGIKKILYKRYPEFTQKKESQKKRRGSGPKPPAPCKSAALLSVEQREPGPDEVKVFQLNPKTGARTKLIVKKSSKGRARERAALTEEKIREIKRRIRQQCPIPYPAA